MDKQIFTVGAKYSFIVACIFLLQHILANLDFILISIHNNVENAALVCILSVMENVSQTGIRYLRDLSHKGLIQVNQDPVFNQKQMLRINAKSKSQKWGFVQIVLLNFNLSGTFISIFVIHYIVFFRAKWKPKGHYLESNGSTCRSVLRYTVEVRLTTSQLFCSSYSLQKICQLQFTFICTN